MAVQLSSASPLQVTPAAVAHIKKMLAKAGKGIGIRLAVKETGCSGKSYVVTIAESSDPQDHVFPLETPLVLCVDPASYAFVKETIIDYIREGLNGKFVFHNPQSKAACGCGESFYV